MDWAAINDSSTNALAGKQVELKAKELQTAPLRGLDKRVEESRAQIHAFYAKRIPANYSSIAARIGDLQVNSGVRLSRVQYTQGPPGSDLTEISMDAGHQRRLSADHALCEQPGARPDLFCDPGDGTDGPAGGAGEPAAAGFHLAAAGRCGGQRIAAHAGTGRAGARSAPAGKEGE